MPEYLSPVFLQKRSQKAGAQTCLARLVRHPALASLKPIVVCGEEGWLVNELRLWGVDVVVLAFPAVRSLAGRLWANRRFCRELAGLLAGRGRTFLIHGNDHQEAPLTLMLGRMLHAPTALFLRSSSMTQEDYEKYRCTEVDALMTVGEELLDKLHQWDPNHSLSVVSDGIYADELTESVTGSSVPPRCFLVLGSPARLKGWRDLIDALVRLQERGRLPLEVTFDFTGSLPGGDNPLDLERLQSDCCRFLGRRNDFPKFSTKYDFVINPSRHETFGMAAIEVMALGVPLLSSNSGVIETVLDVPGLIYPAADVESLAGKLDAILGGFVPTIEQRRHFQSVIRNRYLIDNSARLLLATYASMETCVFHEHSATDSTRILPPSP